MHEGGGRWVGSNKLVELNYCLLLSFLWRRWEGKGQGVGGWNRSVSFKAGLSRISFTVRAICPCPRDAHALDPADGQPTLLRAQAPVATSLAQV